MLRLLWPRRVKIDIEAIRVIGGEFRILPPEPTGLTPETPETPEEDQNAKLVVGCQFEMLGKGGGILARGQASNVENTMDTSVELSDDTLQAFQHFFSLLEQDIANSLGSSSDRNVLEDLLDRQNS